MIVSMVGTFGIVGGNTRWLFATCLWFMCVANFQDLYSQDTSTRSRHKELRNNRQALEKSLINAQLPYVLLLGVAQDAGYPQAGCRKVCCQRAWEKTERRRYTTSLAIVDPTSQGRWLIDCTPDFPEQLHLLDQHTDWENNGRRPLNGILLTHAHIGHYAGLMHLGREVMGAREIPVFAMPRMRYFLETNGPWNQLIKLNQVKIKKLSAGDGTRLNERISVTPVLVPHRDEYSETVAFLIKGPSRTIFYLPDIDKWDRWHMDVNALIDEVDVAFVDGTFFDGKELPGRDMSEIPHPFVSESLSRFAELADEERSKIRFIHLNHTNPLLNEGSKESRQLRELGYQIAEQGSQFEL